MKTMWVVIAVCFFSCALALQAQTSYTWKHNSGGGSWTNAVNWDPAGYPDGADVEASVVREWLVGQTIVLDADVTLGSLDIRRTAWSTSQSTFTLSAPNSETITMDHSSGTFVLTFGRITWACNIHPELTGTNNLDIRASHRLNLRTANTYTGDTYITNSTGNVFIYHSTTLDAEGKIVSAPFGTGTLYLRNARIAVDDDGSYPTRNLHNPIILDGFLFFTSDNYRGWPLNIRGTITLADDGTLWRNNNQWYLDIYSDIDESKPGCSLTLRNDRSDLSYRMTLRGDLKHTGPTTVSHNTVSLYGNNEEATGIFTVNPGATADLRHTSAISSQAEVVLEEDEGTSFGRLNMNQSVTVAGLNLNGVSQPDGEYSETTHPDYFTGAGILTVASPPQRGTVIRIR